MPRLTYAQRCLARTIDVFRVYRPGEEATRAAVIAALPHKAWREHTVYRIQCSGDFGRGPHEVWLPEYILWSLIDLQHYRCPYH